MDEATLIALLESGQLQFAIPAYADGTPILAGDSVLAFNDGEPGRVSGVAATKEEAADYDLGHTAVFVDIGEHSFCFGMEYLLQHPLTLVARAPAA